MMKIFIDFDDVLFNTGEFNSQFERAFGSCGVTRALFLSTYKKARERKGIYNYSFDRHLALLECDHGFDSRKIITAVTDLSRSAEKFVFSDAEDLLVALQGKGHELYLVSFGAPSIQEGKVRGSGLAKYFTQLVVGEISKGKKIKEILRAGDGAKSIFIDDRCAHIDNVKKNCPLIITILVERPEGRYHDKRTDSCDYVISGLSEIPKITALQEIGNE